MFNVSWVNGNREIVRFHSRNIRHSLTGHLRLQLVEIYKIFSLKQFFRKLNLSAPLTDIALSRINGSFLPNLLFMVVWKAIDYTISFSSAYVTHFYYCGCCWKNSRIWFLLLGVAISVRSGPGFWASPQC